MQQRAPRPFPPTLVLTPISRRPTTLPDDTLRTVLDAPIPTMAACPLVDGTPRASVVVVTYDNLAFTRMCLESLLANTEGPSYEVIVVDNASTDGTPEYLRELARHHSHIRLVLNQRNLGFAPANNQALALARGSVLVLLNNDTIVPPGWLAGLVRHLDDPAVGLIGPVTSYAGNEARIDITYRTYAELVQFATERALRHADELFDIPQLEMFCVAMRRDAYERIGTLDEQFAVGMFEDDDYSVRMRRAGYRVACAEGVFVHHFGQASFGKLTPSGEYGELFRTNRARFEKKWGELWQQHRRRRSAEYDRLVDRIRASVREVIPSDATVLVVSKGDEELLDLDGRRAWHFPQLADGTYAGSYPADSAEAIAHLEELRARGAAFLLFPSTSLWWLDHYSAFRRHIEHHGRQASRADDGCVLFALGKDRAEGSGAH